MKYVSEIFALNLNCSLDTCGDWHRSALPWDKVDTCIFNSEDSIFQDYGIESGRKIPEHDGIYYVANHIRAILDMLEHRKINLASGMNDEFICNPAYGEEVFDHVAMLQDLKEISVINRYGKAELRAGWNDIDYLMCFEYRDKWINYKLRKGITPLLPDETKLITKFIDRWRKEDDTDFFFPKLKDLYSK